MYGFVRVKKRKLEKREKSPQYNVLNVLTPISISTELWNNLIKIS